MNKLLQIKMNYLYKITKNNYNVKYEQAWES